MKKMAHEKCVNLQGHSAQRSQESCYYKEKLWYVMDKDIQKYSVLWKNSVFVSDEGLQM